MSHNSQSVPFTAVNPSPLTVNPSPLTVNPSPLGTIYANKSVIYTPGNTETLKHIQKQKPPERIRAHLPFGAHAPLARPYGPPDDERAQGAAMGAVEALKRLCAL